MREKRRHKRFTVDFMDIRGNILFSTHVRILNISLSGVSFSIEKNLNVGGIYVLRLEAKEKILHLRGTIVWAKINEHRKKDDTMITSYTVGMKFVNIRSHQQSAIEYFIKDNFIDYQQLGTSQEVKSGLRIHVRFNIQNPDKATISYVNDYKVKRISQSGMLIESESTLPIEDLIPMGITFSEKEAIAFWGRIITCQAIKSTGPPRYEIGIEFIDISEEDRVTLRAFITSLEENNKMLTYSQ